MEIELSRNKPESLCVEADDDSSGIKEKLKFSRHFA
jgi:hypothetical protein